MGLWRDPAPAGHLQRKKTGTKASEGIPSCDSANIQVIDRPFLVVFWVWVRSLSINSLRGPSEWFGETPGGSRLLEAEVMLLSLLDSNEVVYD